MTEFFIKSDSKDLIKFEPTPEQRRQLEDFFTWRQKWLESKEHTSSPDNEFGPVDLNLEKPDVIFQMPNKYELMWKELKKFIQDEVFLETIETHLIEKEIEGLEKKYEK